MDKAWRFIFSFFYWFVFFWLTFAFLILILILRPLTFIVDRDAKLINMTACLWGSITVWMNPFWRLEIQHRDRLKRGQTYVLVCNHLSVFDPMVLFSLRTPFKWLVKQAAFKIPLVGWGMTVNRYIMVRRDSRRSRGEAMQHCRQWLERGNSILIFPEGTRSRTGDLQAFQPGAFRLAAELGLPLLPMVIEGPQHIMPKDSRFLVEGRAHIRVKILEPIPGGTYTIEQVEAFKDDVHQRMQQALGEMRGALDAKVAAIGMMEHQR